MPARALFATTPIMAKETLNGEPSLKSPTIVSAVPSARTGKGITRIEGNPIDSCTCRYVASFVAKRFATKATGPPIRNTTIKGINTLLPSTAACIWPALVSVNEKRRGFTMIGSFALLAPSSPSSSVPHRADRIMASAELTRPPLGFTTEVATITAVPTSTTTGGCVGGCPLNIRL